MHNIRLFFPSRDRHGRALHDATVAEMQWDLERMLVDSVGGFTRIPASGGYRNRQGIEVREEVGIYEVYAADVDLLRVAARQLAVRLDQETVLLVVDSKPEFVRAPQLQAAIREAEAEMMEDVRAATNN